MATLYVTEPGSQVRREYQRLLVTKKGEVLLAVPARQVSEVVLVGRASVTMQAMLMLLDSDVGLTLVTRSGQMRGRLRPAQAHNIPLRRLQYDRSQQPDFALAIGRAIVRGKLTNCRTMVLRMTRRHLDEENRRPAEVQARLTRIEENLAAAQTAADLDELRGLEGSAAQAYFGVLRANLQQDNLGFDRRTRRPPKDPANALLSLGYTLLADALFTAAEVAGLDPYAGFFHSEKYGRPALALDLMEEFRAIVVDSVLLSLVNKRMLSTRDFEPGPNGGVYLTRRGMRVFLAQFNRRLNTPIYHPVAGRSLSYQKCFEIQARQLRRVIEGELDHYQPLTTR